MENKLAQFYYDNRYYCFNLYGRFIAVIFLYISLFNYLKYDKIRISIGGKYE